MTQLQSFDVTKLHLSKPKKSENNTYVCQCYHIDKEHPAEIEIDNVYIISYASHNTVVVKAPKFVYDFFFAISNKIISIVKEKRSTWFSTSMPDDLVDEYYSHPIIYDEKHGDLLRLKVSPCENDVLDLPLKKRCRMRVVLDCVRIHKQKFSPEWSIKEVVEDVVDFLDDDEEDDTEDVLLHIPYEDIRKDYIKSLDHLIISLSSHLDKAQSLKEELQKSSHKQLVGICERVDNMMSADEFCNQE